MALYAVAAAVTPRQYHDIPCCQLLRPSMGDYSVRSSSSSSSLLSAAAAAATNENDQIIAYVALSADEYIFFWSICL